MVEVRWFVMQLVAVAFAVELLRDCENDQRFYRRVLSVYSVFGGGS